MRVLVYGGRDFARYDLLSDLLNRLHSMRPITLMITGMATGADTLGKQWANEHGVEFHGYPAKWDDLEAPGAMLAYNRMGKPYNKLAGFQRNQQMVDEEAIDVAIECPGGRGTADMRRRLQEAGIETIRL